MQLTDQNVKTLLEKIRSAELESRIADYPEEERDGRSDMELFRDELDYYLDDLEDNGHALHDALKRSRKILKETKHGIVMPLDKDFNPVYRKSEVEDAKNLVNEYNRLKRLQQKLS